MGSTDLGSSQKLDISVLQKLIDDASDGSSIKQRIIMFQANHSVLIKILPWSVHQSPLLMLGDQSDTDDR